MTTSTPVQKARSLFEPAILRQAVLDAFYKLDPRHQVKNPVMFVVWIGSVLTTALFIQALLGTGEASPGFILSIALWLWFTVLFANFAEAMAEGRGKAQADSLRKARRDLTATKLFEARRDAVVAVVPAGSLRKGEIVLVEAGEFIPCDGEVIQGVASVNESAITGESAPVIRESGGGSQRRHGRHEGPFRLADHSRDRQSRRKFSGPDDCHGGGSQTAENAE